MSEPAEPVFGKDIDERVPQPEKEDGELSDGDEERLEAGTSKNGYSFVSNGHISQSEFDIDRTIQEALAAQEELDMQRCLNGDTTPSIIETLIIPTPNSIKNMLDPGYIQECSTMGIPSADSVTEDMEDLRIMALNSMKVNGPEDGEIREPTLVINEGPQSPDRIHEERPLSPPPQPPRRPSIVERFRVDVPPLDYSRVRDNYVSPTRPSSRTSWPSSQFFDKGNSQPRSSYNSYKKERKSKWMDEEKRPRIRTKRNISPYRPNSSDKRRERREKERSEERRMQDFPPIISPTHVPIVRPIRLLDYMPNLPPPLQMQMHQNMDRNAYQDRVSSRHTTSDELVNIVLGNLQPQVDSAFSQSRDNHDLVAMDVSTTPEPPQRSCTPFGPNPSNSMASVLAGRRRSLESEESVLRNTLMEQVKKRRVATPNEEENMPEMEEEEKYLKNKAELIQLETSMVQRMEKMRQMKTKKLELMKQLEVLMTEMTSWQEEYWKEKERKDVLRPLVEEYETEQVLRFGMDDSLSIFYSRLEEQTSLLKDVTMTAQQKLPKAAIEAETPTRAAIAVQTSPPPTSSSVVEQSTISSTSVEQEMDVSPTDENEIQLRQILLEKQKSKTVPNAVTSTQSSATPSPVVPEKVVAVSTKALVTPEKTAYAPLSPQSRASPIAFTAEETDHGQLWRTIQSRQFPVRLLAHAGVQLPNSLEASRELCSHEMMGKCKSVDCNNRHLKDDELELREVVSMILWGVPKLAGSRVKESHSNQVNHLLDKKKSDEDRVHFVRRILRPLLDSSGLLELGLKDFLMV